MKAILDFLSKVTHSLIMFTVICFGCCSVTKGAERFSGTIAASAVTNTGATRPAPRKTPAFERQIVRALPIEAALRVQLDQASTNLAKLPPWTSLPAPLRAQSVSKAITELRAPAEARETSLTPVSARLAEPFFHVEGTREVARQLQSSALEAQAATVVEARQMQFVTARQGFTSRLDREKVNGAALRLDRASLQLVGEWKRRTDHLEQNRASMPVGVAQEEAERLDQMKNLVAELFRWAEALDHSQVDNLRMMSASTVRRIAANFNLLVAVAWEEVPGGPTEFLGTGFFYSNRVVTCAHLFTSKWIPPKRDFSKVVLHPYRASSEDFDRDTRIPVNPAGCAVFPEVDTACLTLVQHPAARQALESAAQAPIWPARDVTRVSFGPVYALSALKTGSRLEAKWMPPGRIVFPPAVQLLSRNAPESAFTCQTVPFEAGNLGQVDDRFLRVLRQELSAHLFGLVGQEEFCRALAEVGANYDTRLFGEVFQLTAPIRIASNLELFSCDLNFRNRHRLPCLGTDLPSEPGASGSPVFLLTEDESALLIGFNLGPKGEQSGSPTASSLADYTRVMPFYLAMAVLESFIRENP